MDIIEYSDIFYMCGKLADTLSKHCPCKHMTYLCIKFVKIFSNEDAGHHVHVHINNNLAYKTVFVQNEQLSCELLSVPTFANINYYLTISCNV